MGTATSTTTDGTEHRVRSLLVQPARNLRDDWQRFWELEEVPTRPISSPQDEACESGSRSINDYLAAGPKLQTDLCAIITRWRFHRHAFSMDIVKMFRQIKVHPEDRDCQRVVWSDDPSEEVRDFRLTTVTYGTTSAPYLATRVLLQLADDEKARYPRGAAMLRANAYVDDILAGGDDIGDAEEARRQLSDIFTVGGFPLDKWATNYMPSSSNLVELLQGHQETGALGLKWSTANDTLSLATPKLTAAAPGQRWTKRVVLSETAMLFDPLGWLSPITVTAKILLQDLWLSG
ncbi:PREDICTED: uncharacterized protein LOC107191235 [Dufourea novaeangliae]|uniref:uncharacterized protein LOC107191235 n=1 Tax=Dufourea novaeangliae TaxID=178035 RepID=UPI000767306A|nr:PREDICTED: uncharacterized protein LOC107191235 [Dufourea novaeangliae]